MFKRNTLFNIRNPHQAIALAGCAAVLGALQANVFHGVGSERYTYDVEHDDEITSNFIGLAFIVTTEEYTFSALHQVLRIPDRAPVFKREYSNHMYTISAYYCAALAAALTTSWIYPLSAGGVGYYWFAFEDRSFTDFLFYEAGLMATCLAGNFFGFMFGCMFTEQVTALAMIQLFNMSFNFGAGCWVNIGKGASPPVRFFSWISPVRYGIELTMRRVTAGKHL